MVSSDVAKVKNREINIVLSGLDFDFENCSEFSAAFCFYRFFFCQQLSVLTADLSCSAALARNLDISIGTI